MHSEYIFSPLSQFEVLSLIGFNAPILNYLNLSLTNLGGRFMSLGFFSFIVNSILLILIDKNIFGSKIKIFVDNIFVSRKTTIFICIYYFVFVYILIFIVRDNMSTIYLETVKVNVVINGVEADISGDILATARVVFGDAAVFVGSARLAYLIIAKNPSLGAF